MAPEMGSCDHRNEVFSPEERKFLTVSRLSADHGVLTYLPGWINQRQILHTDTGYFCN